jgi:hypothetical protein
MSYQRVEGVVSAAGANAIDEQAGLGIALRQRLRSNRLTGQMNHRPPFSIDENH